MSTADDRHMVYIPGLGCDLRLPMPDDRNEEEQDWPDHSDEPGDPGPDEGREPIYPRPTWQEE